MNKLKAIFFLFSFSITLFGFGGQEMECSKATMENFDLGNCHCGHDMEENSHCKHSCKSQENKGQKVDKNCCGIDKMSATNDGFYAISEINDVQFIVITAIFDYHILIEESTRANKLETYIPPLLYHDIPIMIQSFLI